MKANNRSGIGFLGLLAIVFIGLKLAGVGVVASWSWWWVLAPLWVVPVFLFSLAGVLWIVYLILDALDRK